jgi:Phage integrase family
MGVRPLALVGGTPGETDRYSNWLEARLTAISPLLVDNPVWSDAVMSEVFGHPWLSLTYASLPLGAAVPVLTNEIKAYLAASVLDDRKADAHWFQRRIPVIQYLVEEGANLLQHFGAACLADIPHPNFGSSDGDGGRKPNYHNDAVLERYATWYGAKYGRRRQSQTRHWIRDGEIVTGQYRSPEVQLFGDIHRFSIINRAQMAPMPDRDIILLNDLYSEEDTRFRDRQRRSDIYLNFLCFEEWLRPLMRGFLLDKVAHGELAPATMVAMLSRLRVFARFLREEQITYPKQINELTMERYLAWGNAQAAAGKNWYTDIVQLLRAAPVLLPGQWPRIALDKRAARRIRYKQAPDDPRNRLYASREGANRAAPSEALTAMVARLDELPAPIPVIFTIGITTGARAEDLHALLFDCLRPDPHDKRFMLFTFWQNKVSRWNTKPLLLTDPAHQAMIELIEAQRHRVRQRYGRAPKYLFPVFYGKRESFLGYNWTLQELKMLCLRHGILDGEGKPFDFSWHPLRHHRGTQMATEGHDILSIMFELGHASPDMASMYVNKRLELKKNALLRKGGGKFYTIEGKVDEAVGDLLLRKETMMATRVCGGACTLPGQLGEWCEHAHACLTCRFFRADGDDLEHFRCERSKLYVAIEDLEQEAQDYEEKGQARMADISHKRLNRNKDAVQNTDTIIRSIESHGLYKGSQQRYKPAAAREEALP